MVTPIGHVRYSTTGNLRNVQPLFADLTLGGLLAHNGNLTNGLTLRHELKKKVRFSNQLRHKQFCNWSRDQENTISRFIDALSQIEGAYALVALTNRRLIGVRDPLGIRPWYWGN